MSFEGSPHELPLFGGEKLLGVDLLFAEKPPYRRLSGTTRVFLTYFYSVTHTSSI
jgi:hypothetical protein